MTRLRDDATPRRFAWLWLCLMTITAGACRSERTSTQEQPTELHGVGGVEGVDAAYDRSRQPAKLVAALGIAPGQRVADVGAGLGYLTLRLSDAVGPTGQVVATDINDEALGMLRTRVSERKNIVVRKVPPDAPGLEKDAYDLILLSEVDHFFSDRVAYLTQLRSALTPNGRIAVTHLRAMRPPLVAAAEAAGYSVVSEYNGLPEHYLLFLQPVVSH
ncbi:class I SAM-dependent methyltransferase [Hyalangium minutum]|uniref:class I SAM-dependent methyltransferase n=1 Tax=Hyalangium minutum TaxID=394096 RepID=UPI0009FD88A8|nr:methyltransferase [Hyalangium minutum]